MMKSFEADEILNQAYRMTATIVFVQIFSVFLLVMLVWGIPLEEQQVTNTVLNILWVSVLMVAVAVVFLRRFFFSERRLLEKAKDGAQAVIRALKSNTILLAALAELVGILGFLIAILSSNKMNVLRATAVSLLLFLITFPRKSRWQRIIHRVLDFQNYGKSI